MKKTKRYPFTYSIGKRKKTIEVKAQTYDEALMKAIMGAIREEWNPVKLKEAIR